MLDFYIGFFFYCYLIIAIGLSPFIVLYLTNNEILKDEDLGFFNYVVCFNLALGWPIALLVWAMVTLWNSSKVRE